jgi:hypothetical protein
MRYVESSGVDAHRCLAGAVALQQSMMMLSGFGTKGCYNFRPVRGSTAPSVHGDGRAIDMAVDRWASPEQGVWVPPPMSWNTPEGADPVLVERMFQWRDTLISHCDDLGIQLIIFWRLIWTCDRPWFRTYSGSAGPHHDHAHIELHPSRADSLTAAEIFAVVIPREQQIPAEQEDDMASHLWKDPRYQNVFAQPGGGTVTGAEISGTDAPLRQLHTVEEQHDQKLAQECFRAWGIVGPTADAVIKDAESRGLLVPA